MEIFSNWDTISKYHDNVFWLGIQKIIFASVVEVRHEMYDQLYEFLNRDFTNDIDELNELLNLKGNARLANEVPPNPFVGDPDFRQVIV